MEKLRLAVCISGKGSNLHSLIKSNLHESFPAKIALVVSNKKEAAGLKIAKNAGITTSIIDEKKFKIREDFDAELHELLKATDVKLICLAGFMRILSNDFCNIWKDRLINIHPSLLPSFRGLNAQQQAYCAGVKFSGCTVHYVRPKLDSGPIIIQSVVPILPNDTLEKVKKNILLEEHKIYPEAVRLIANNKISIKGDRVIFRHYSLNRKPLTNPPIKKK